MHHSIRDIVWQDYVTQIKSHEKLSNAIFWVGDVRSAWGCRDFKIEYSQYL